MLEPGGRYFAQHVGPASAFELIEHFLGPLPRERLLRDPEAEAGAARRAGLVVTDLRTARCRMELHDVGAVVWLLRKCVWWVPGFSVVKYREVLEGLDAQLRGGEPLVAHSTRHSSRPGGRADEEEGPSGTRATAQPTSPGFTHAVSRSAAGYPYH